MEQHPVPQNVTTFQFRLIGDMTIKQFGYLAGGAILAYISYKLPLPFFFTWPMTIIFAAGGVGFAFVPIEERPMDVWVMSFLKNVYSPTLYVWEKAALQPPAVAPQPQTVIRTPPVPAPATVRPTHQPAPVIQQTQTARTRADIVGNVYGQAGGQNTIARQPQGAAHVAQQNAPPPPSVRPMPAPQKQTGFFAWLTSLFAPKSGATHAPPASDMLRQAARVTTPSVAGTHLDFSMPPTVSVSPRTPKENSPDTVAEVQKKEEELREKASEIKHELEKTSMTESRILELQKQLTEVLTQKDKMEVEFNALRRQMSSQSPQSHVTPPTQPVAAPPPVQSAPATQTTHQPTVKIITREGAVKAGLPRLTTFPNVVTGITKDSENNLLPGVLVTVKDKDGIPVRALKTNRLGQFAASTPLSNGVYFVEIEDPRFRYTFDRVQITLNGSIVPALEIIAKSQRQVVRDQLTKEIFGNINGQPSG